MFLLCQAACASGLIWVSAWRARWTTLASLRLRSLRASRLVDPVSMRRLMKACASEWMRAWVIAMRWSAALVCRFPPRLSRNLVLLADQTGMWAIPAHMAYASRALNRVMSADSPMSLPAVNARIRVWRGVR